MSSTSKKYRLLLYLGLFCLSFALRLIDIGLSPFWYDEIISVKDTFLEFGHIKHQSEWDSNPPFYYYCLWIWKQIFGTTESGIRSFSAFFSSLSVLFVLKIAESFCTIWKAVLIAILFSLYPLVFYYAQEARCYSLLLFLITLNLWLTYRFLKAPTMTSALLLGVSDFLLFYTHYLTCLLLACQAILLLFYFRKVDRKLLVIGLVPLVLVLVRFTKKQYQFLFYSTALSNRTNNVELANGRALFQILIEIFENPLFLFVVFTSVIWYFLSGQKRSHEKPQNYFITYIITTPLACIFLLFIIGMHSNLFASRYLVFTIPITMLLFAVVKYPRFIIESVLGIFILFFASKLEFGKSKKMDFRTAGEVAKNIQINDKRKVIVQTHDLIPLFEYYYNMELFQNNDRQKAELMSKYHLLTIDRVDDLKSFSDTTFTSFLVLQTFHPKDDENKIDNYFESKGYIRFTTNSIEGIRLSYFSR